ncbi:NAD-glutamate dehydrogenase [Bartonella sp. DGB1]|uniref:NAD-glutamate dehydrogenase n=1 Tax=Bartonella sp. DGB1 TaxID=3239807 RepID=UPI0035240026
MLTNINPHQASEVTLTKNICSNSKELTDFTNMFFAWVSESDLDYYDTASKNKAAKIAFETLLQYQGCEPFINIDESISQKNGRPLTVLTIINDNKPFLVDTIIGQINKLKLSLQLIAHPVFNITKIGSDTIKIHSKTTKQEDQKQLSVVQIHLSKLNEDIQKKLLSALDKSLKQAIVAVRDWRPMVNEINKIITDYNKPLENQNFEDRLQVVNLLHWLVNDNFVILGLREYRYNKNALDKMYLYPKGVQLGILQDETILILKNNTEDETPAEILSFMQSDSLFIVTKANARSQVHRQTWLDYIGVKLFDKDGQLYGEMRIIGLFRANAYTNSIFSIPHLKSKAQEVIKSLGFGHSDYSGKAIINILETYPRELLFRISEKDLTRHIKYILELKERPKTKVLVSDDEFGRFVSILIYIPRDLVNFGIQQKITNFLTETFQSNAYEFSPLFLENSLTYLNYTIYSKGQNTLPKIDRDQLELNIKKIATPWSESIEEITFNNPAINGEVAAIAKNFSQAYKDQFSANEAVIDAQHILTLTKEKPLSVRFNAYKNEDENHFNIKLYHKKNALALSARVPILERMGFKVISEQTFALTNNDGVKTYIHDMLIRPANNDLIQINELSGLLEDSFYQIWVGNVDNDYYNSLIVTAKLDWQQIVVLRAYGSYLQQIGISYSQDFIANSLNNNPNLSRAIYQLFNLRFNPQFAKQKVNNDIKELTNKIELMLQDVQSLDEDTIFRRYLCLVLATIRTNAFQNLPVCQLPEALAFKFKPSKIEFLPRPRPYREIFVYSTAVEGVHLRFGPVARGGIRWSDRAQDYRTEILGLVKAQQVKNAVIVPLGSKGGFYPKKLPNVTDRSIINQAGREAYITYITALLSVTDNIVNQQVVTPKNVIKYDKNDPYFVLAADKGTATFSDTANSVSQKYNFWLDDAFASGGSAGYDHKKMGITAKGAWEAVKRHFREMDYDIQTQPFTVVGVGDMSGDVFGNGMLLSPKIRLIAAFDHRDIFLDPNPDESVSFEERKRLFQLPRSSWQDYDTSKLSAGGGIYSRSAKTITLSKEAAKAIGFDKLQATPLEIIKAILKAPADLLWFGGIGTYVRGSNESDLQVGDHANDLIRITGKEVKAKVIGEGANLGVTPLGRIEFCLNKGHCNSDAIDNSAGVNCSDVEVNIKIAFAQALAENKITREERNKLLESMTDEVSEKVLLNNYEQTLSLSLEQKKGLTETVYQDRFMTYLETRGLLDRNIETLPNSQEIEERIQKKIPLTRPELAIIMAYAKNTLTEDLTKGDLINDPYLKTTLLNYFPVKMQENYSQQLEQHQLRQNIIAMILSNDIINRLGAAAIYKLQETFSASVDDILKAYIIARDGFDFITLYQEINALDNKISGVTQNELYSLLANSLTKVTCWLLRHTNNMSMLEEQIKDIQNINDILRKKLKIIVPQNILEGLAKKENAYKTIGLSETLSFHLAYLGVIPIIPDIMLIAKRANVDIETATKNYFILADIMGKNNLENTSFNISRSDYYDNIALNRANDTIAEAFRNILVAVICNFSQSDDPVNMWYNQDKEKIRTMQKKVKDLLLRNLTVSRFTVAAYIIADFATSLDLQNNN